MVKTQIDDLRKEMIQSRNLDTGRQQRLPPELEDLKQDFQIGVNTREFSQRDSPMLNPLYRHEHDSNSDFHIQQHLGTFKPPRLKFPTFDGSHLRN